MTASPQPDAGFDAGLLARVEDAGINASAPRQQRWVDGWLLRTSPGKAKRARCIQAVAAGTSSIEDRLARCLAAFAQAQLRPYVRITPFSQPAGLDEHLERIGMERVDDSLVMVAPIETVLAVPTLTPTLSRPAGEGGEPAGTSIEAIDAESFAEWIGAARGSSAQERRAHAERVVGSPVPYRAFVVRDRSSAIVSGGQLAIEDELAGFYDVLTIEAQRGRGLAAALCMRLAEEAGGDGVKALYLQVDAGNAPAIALYRRLGFRTGYGYHYRTPRDDAAGEAPRG